MNTFDKEPVTKRLDRVRPTLLSKLREWPPNRGIPNELKNAVATYLLLNPGDGEVRQARDKLRGSSPQSLRGPDLRP